MKKTVVILLAVALLALGAIQIAGATETDSLDEPSGNGKPSPELSDEEREQFEQARENYLEQKEALREEFLEAVPESMREHMQERRENRAGSQQRSRTRDCDNCTMYGSDSI